MNRMRSGQALLIVLLVLGVAVTIALSIIARSVTEVAVSTTQDESVKALEAAEAGVEKALGGVIAVGGETLPTNNSSFDVSTSGVGNAQYYEVPYFLEAGEVATVDLSYSPTGDVYTNNNIRICWGRGSGTVPAMEAILYYRQNSPVQYVASRRVFDSTGRSSQNSFSSASSGCPNGPPGYSSGAYSSQIGMNNAVNGFGMPNSGNTPLFLRIRLLYNTTPWQVAVVAVGGDNIPTQGKDIISTGQSGDATQKLHVIQSTPDFPLMFDSALFSGGTLVQ